MTRLDPRIAAVTDRIIERSRPTRRRYLDLMAAQGELGISRSRMSCGNFAHGFAAAEGDKDQIRTIAGPNIGIRHPASRIAALRANPAVALTIDTEGFPARSLTIRGEAVIDEVEGLAPEYVASARRYLGEEAAIGMVAAMDQPGTVQARITVRPSWVGLLDFATRLPSPLGGV